MYSLLEIVQSEVGRVAELSDRGRWTKQPQRLDWDVAMGNDKG